MLELSHTVGLVALFLIVTNYLPVVRPQASTEADAPAYAYEGAERDAAASADVEALLRLHHAQRVYHVLGDAKSLVADFADGLVEVGAGRSRRSSREAARARFDGYFEDVRFLEWDDVRPPRIRVSPGGAWAEVIVEKRVRTIPADTLASKQDEAVAFAWVERWRKERGAWQLATIASTARGIEEEKPVSFAARVRAFEILRRARAALGGDDAVARVATLRFVAECEGPNGSFTTEVASARDGRVSFVQHFPDRPTFAAGRSLDGGWVLSGDRAVVDSLGAVMGTVVTAHEMMLLALAPEARYRAPAARPAQVVDGREMNVVAFTDALGGEVLFWFDDETGLPARFAPVNHTGQGPAEIVTVLGGWQDVGDVRLPHAITITQGEAQYVYRITDATTDWLPDTTFAPSR